MSVYFMPAGQDFTVHNLQDYTAGTDGITTYSEICFDVLAEDDGVSEGREMASFQLHLSTEVVWVVLDMPQQIIVEVIIEDSDGKVTYRKSCMCPNFTLVKGVLNL